MMKRLAAAALVAAAGFGLVACGSSDNSTTSPGARTAVLEDSSPVPVADNPTATLPVTVKSFDGVDVTITDNSRIVAADRYGTLATTTVALGLGDNLVGRDTAAKFPSVADVPVVTVGGQSLNTEAILDLNPTVVLTDTSIGPKSVQDQLRAAGVPVVFFDSGAEFPETYEFVQRVAQEWKLNFQVYAAEPPLLEMLSRDGGWQHERAADYPKSVSLHESLIAEPARRAHADHGPGGDGKGGDDDCHLESLNRGVVQSWTRPRESGRAGHGRAPW